MRTHRILLVVLLLVANAAPAMTQSITRYVRYSHGGTTSYGILDAGGQQLRELRGDPFANNALTGRTFALKDVRLLAPVAPSKVIAVGLNYQSHLGERPPARYPGLFTKYPTSIIASGDPIPLTSDAANVHYEGEMVIVIGRRAKNVAREAAKSHVFGVTAGNDVSERSWQRADLQWFRAKASDGFGPIGPAIVTGLNYDDLLLQTRLNGTVVQSQRTRDLIFSVADIVSYVSHYVTLEPGDVIFTGTPGTTQQMKAGDVIEVELEGVGVLTNRVTQSSAPPPTIVAAGTVAQPSSQPMASGGFPIHSTDRPQPPVVRPPALAGPRPAPADAIVLFDGMSLAKWRSSAEKGPARWRVADGYMEVVRGTGSIETVQSFGDAQLHIEWMTPSPPRGEGQNRGNSGVFLMGRYEVQIHDSHENATYPDGQAGAIYGQFPPLVNASRRPGEWQEYDIIFHAPQFDVAGTLTSPARMTVFHNGVLVQDNVALLGPTSHRRRDPYEAHADRLPLSLQDHGEPVRFRNIWIRALR